MKPPSYIALALIWRLIGAGLVLPMMYFVHADKYLPDIQTNYQVPEKRKPVGLYARLFILFYAPFMAYRALQENKIEEELNRFDPSRPTQYRPP